MFLECHLHEPGETPARDPRDGQRLGAA
jgi:hypothetical protein